MHRLVLISALVIFVSGARIPKGAVSMLDGRIVGGSATTIEKFPHQVSVSFRGSHFCGGSVLTTNYILTAGHCVYAQIASDFFVRAGSSLHASGGTIHEVVALNKHDKYDPFLTDYDVAVLRLSNSLTISNSVQPISIVTSLPPAGTLLIVSGWGTLSVGGSSPSRLHYVDVPLVSMELCKEQYIFSEITDRMVCAGYVEGGKDSCQKDSGGPLIVTNSTSGKPEQVGVVSWGAGCGYPNSSGIYADLTNPSIAAHINNVIKE